MKAANNICCKECDKCENCYDIHIGKLDDAVSRIDNQFYNYVRGAACEVQWGYSTCNLSDEVLDKLLLFRGVIKDHRESIICGSTPCLCDSEIQRVIEKVLKLTTKVKTIDKIYVNDSSREQWLLDNPDCCGYDPNEDQYYKKSVVINTNIKLKEKQEIELEYSVQSENKKEVILNISVEEEKQSQLELGSIYSESTVKSYIDVRAYSALKKQCEIDFEYASQLIICGLDFKFKSNEVVACKIDANIASNLKHDCDLDIKFNIEDSTIEADGFSIKVEEVEKPEIIEKILNE